MIERTINYCWFGNNKKNKTIKKCIESWKSKCPDFKIIEWNEKNFDINCNQFVKNAYAEKKWAFVSDYARLWVIYNYGGVYLDTDVELVKNIPGDLLKDEGFFCLEGKHINTGLGFAAEKGDELVKELLDSYDKIEEYPYDLDTCVKYNKIIFDKYFDDYGSLRQKNKSNGYYIMPSQYFCPYDYQTGKLTLTDETIGIHWYAGSWQSRWSRFKTKIKIFLNKF